MLTDNMKVIIRLKQINQKLKETVNSLPLDLWDLNPEAFLYRPKLELQKNITSLQKGIITEVSDKKHQIQINI